MLKKRSEISIYLYFPFYVVTFGVDEWIHGEYKDVGTRCGSVAGFYYGRDVTNWHLTDNENQELREENRPNKIRLLATILARKNKGKFQEFF